MCQICNDHSPRAGFKFDGDFVGYNCFNCGAKGKLDKSHAKVSKAFRNILNSFGISNEDIDNELARNFLNKESNPKSSNSKEQLKN